MVVAGSGPRAVVTTASYEARRYGVFSATPASRARRLCPGAVFVQPEFDHYRERSQAVMETVREQIETVEVVGLDEAYLDLTRDGKPGKAAARRMKAAVARGHRAGVLDRHRPQQAGGQGGLGRGKAGRLPGAHRRRRRASA